MPETRSLETPPPPHPFWLQTASGAVLDLMEPSPETIRLTDVIQGLSKTARFGGQTTGTFYSVAQHSVLVASFCRGRARLYGLIHDAHEAYLGDWPSPVKAAMASLGAGEQMELLARGLDWAIHAAFGLPWPPSPEIAAAVRRADLLALAAERRDLMGPGPEWGLVLPDPVDVPTIRPMPWNRAAASFGQALVGFARERVTFPEIASLPAPVLSRRWGMAIVQRPTATEAAT